MDRRAFLATGGTILVAGCSSGGGEATDTTQESTDAVGGTSAQTTARETTATTASEPTATESGNDEATTTATVVEEAPEMAIASSGWHDGSDKLEFTVKNVNETKVGSVDVAIEWFDNGGRYLGQTSRRLAGIGPERRGTRASNRRRRTRRPTTDHDAQSTAPVVDAGRVQPRRLGSPASRA